MKYFNRCTDSASEINRNSVSFSAIWDSITDFSCTWHVCFSFGASQPFEVSAFCFNFESNRFGFSMWLFQYRHVSMFRFIFFLEDQYLERQLSTALPFPWPDFIIIWRYQTGSLIYRTIDLLAGWNSCYVSATVTSNQVRMKCKISKNEFQGNWAQIPTIQKADATWSFYSGKIWNPITIIYSYFYLWSILVVGIVGVPSEVASSAVRASSEVIEPHLTTPPSCFTAEIIPCCGQIQWKQICKNFHG